MLLPIYRRTKTDRRALSFLLFSAFCISFIIPFARHRVNILYPFPCTLAHAVIYTLDNDNLYLFALGLTLVAIAARPDRLMILVDRREVDHNSMSSSK